MGVQVPFDYNGFVTLFPQFAYISQPTVQALFALAEMYVRNDGCGPVCNATLQSNLLNLMTAHLCALFAQTSTGQNPPNAVGRVQQAGEGSVNVSLQFDAPPQAQWYIQTPYGAAFWTLAAPFRTMLYRPAPERLFNNPFFAGPGGFIIQQILH